MKNLLATPKIYQGQRVEVTGYLHLEFEGDYICPDKKDYINKDDDSTIWVNLVSRAELDSLRKFSDNYVVIYGVFNFYNKGNRDFFTRGSIEKIHKIVLAK
jgi:hypothetical protein